MVDDSYLKSACFILPDLLLGLGWNGDFLNLHLPRLVLLRAHLFLCGSSADLSESLNGIIDQSGSVYLHYVFAIFRTETISYIF
jgi:hypothetical protein